MVQQFTWGNLVHIILLGLTYLGKLVLQSGQFYTGAKSNNLSNSLPQPVENTDYLT